MVVVAIISGSPVAFCFVYNSLPCNLFSQRSGSDRASKSKVKARYKHGGYLIAWLNRRRAFFPTLLLLSCWLSCVCLCLGLPARERQGIGLWHKAHGETCSSPRSITPETAATAGGSRGSVWFCYLLVIYLLAAERALERVPGRAAGPGLILSPFGRAEREKTGPLALFCVSFFLLEGEEIGLAILSCFQRRLTPRLV